MQKEILSLYLFPQPEPQPNALTFFQTKIALHFWSYTDNEVVWIPKPLRVKYILA